MRDSFKQCGNCAYWQHGSSICPIFKTNMPEDEYCPNHLSAQSLCDICGKQKANTLEQFNTKLFQYCDDCIQYMGTCATCFSGNYCAFQQDTSVNLPKTITQTFRQGNMTIQQESINPERIEKTCKNCKCFNLDDFYCFRNFNNCGNWSFILDKEENNNA